MRRSALALDIPMRGYTTSATPWWSLLLQLKTPPHVVQRIARHADLDAVQEALDSIKWNDRLAFGWWAQQDSNLRPLACKASALPLSYAPDAIRTQVGNAARACFQTVWSRASPGPFISAKRIMPSVSTRKVPRLAKPVLSLKTP